MKNLKRKFIQVAEELVVADFYAPEDLEFFHDKDVIVRGEACEIARDWASDPEDTRESASILRKTGMTP